MRFLHWRYTIPLRLRSLFRRNVVESELEEELRFHLDQKTEQGIAGGLPLQEARRAALRSLEGLEQKKEECRDMRYVLWMENLARDTRYAARQLRRAPGFTIVAALTLALGIGATTAAFSILDPWLIRPLPLKDAHRLFVLWRTAAGAPGQPAFFFNYFDYQAFAKSNHVFTSMGASFFRSFTMTASGSPVSVSGQIASGSLFPTLKVHAQLGRVFVPEDVSGPPVAILSAAFWKQRFGASRKILGKDIRLNDQPYRVIGVLPPRFSYRLLDAPEDVGVWTLIQAGDPQYGVHADDSPVGIVGRLLPSITPAQAQRELSAIQHRTDLQYPNLGSLNNSGTLVASLQADKARPVRTSLLLLSLAAACILLIACANTAALILGRMTERRKEFAVRAALGSGISRLAQQLLAENLLLYLAGASLGLLGAWVAIDIFRNWNPFGSLPPEGIHVNGRALVAASGVTFVCALLFGLLPALQAARKDMRGTLNARSYGLTSGRNKLQARMFIVGLQISLCLPMVTAAGLLLTTLANLENQPFGFDTENVQTLSFSLPSNRYSTKEKQTQFVVEILDRLRRLPGVRYASLSPLITSGDQSLSPFTISGKSAQRTKDLPRAADEVISSQFFQTVRIPIIRGRGFLDSDTARSHPVAVLNEMAVRRYFPNTNPIGQTVRLGDPNDKETQRTPWYTIVGIVGDTRSVAYNRMAWKTVPKIWTDFRQNQRKGKEGVFGAATPLFAIRSESTTLPFLRLQKLVWSLDKDLPVEHLRPLQSDISRQLAQPRLRARTVGIFSGLALLLTAIGIYGALMQSVLQRRREIAVRYAVGADRKNIVVLILKNVLLVCAVAIVAGTAIAFAFVRYLQSVVWGVSPLDPLFLASAIAIIFLVSLAAAYLPARRAASTDPMQVLRQE